MCVKPSLRPLVRTPVAERLRTGPPFHERRRSADLNFLRERRVLRNNWRTWILFHARSFSDGFRIFFGHRDPSARDTPSGAAPISGPQNRSRQTMPAVGAPDSSTLNLMSKSSVALWVCRDERGGVAVEDAYDNANRHERNQYGLPVGSAAAARPRPMAVVSAGGGLAVTSTRIKTPSMRDQTLRGKRAHQVYHHDGCTRTRHALLSSG